MEREKNDQCASCLGAPCDWKHFGKRLEASQARMRACTPHADTYKPLYQVYFYLKHGHFDDKALDVFPQCVRISLMCRERKKALPDSDQGSSPETSSAESLSDVDEDATTASTSSALKDSLLVSPTKSPVPRKRNVKPADKPTVGRSRKQDIQYKPSPTKRKRPRQDAQPTKPSKHRRKDSTEQAQVRAEAADASIVGARGGVLGGRASLAAVASKLAELLLAPFLLQLLRQLLLLSVVVAQVEASLRPNVSEVAGSGVVGASGGVLGDRASLAEVVSKWVELLLSDFKCFHG
ncbi:hypothetical protein PR001_g18355 [Phytophthora rubi]|uniref:Uncharacterized protein n=1 Tax=Phytophthora rubi TaxID=129364 RepID=A0A6A3KBJ7_9STRA|nr:hypothetical protein PR002_g18741 [Phytophthora rubi]KAE9002075.1 hypothetical protein PR001_g18355 [Phytophthora rubi]